MGGTPRILFSKMRGPTGRRSRREMAEIPMKDRRGPISAARRVALRPTVDATLYVDLYATCGGGPNRSGHTFSGTRRTTLARHTVYDIVVSCSAYFILSRMPTRHQASHRYRAKRAPTSRTVRHSESRRSHPCPSASSVSPIQGNLRTYAGHRTTFSIARLHQDP